jgi:hypothetical protein
MPPRLVYAVNFSHGNLNPTVDLNAWGQMKLGGTASGLGTTWPDAFGLNVSLTRNFNDPQFATRALFVLPPQQSLPIKSRFRMRIEFDRPSAAGLPQPIGVERGNPTPEPWAVALVIKLGNEVDVDPQPAVPVTCQFNRTMNGIRLNSPQGALQKDQSKVMVSPLDYPQFNPPFWNDLLPPPGIAGWLASFLGGPRRFTLEHAFAGFDYDTAGHTVSCGALSISGYRPDQRVFSNAAISTNPQTWIGALGISIATIDGIGTMRARFRFFTVETWT